MIRSITFDNLTYILHVIVAHRAAMPLHIAAQGLFSGISSIPYAWTVLKIAPWLVLLYVLKRYFNGATNTSERTMHSKVIMMTVRRQLVI
jgi:hypothetical protein